MISTCARNFIILGLWMGLSFSGRNLVAETASDATVDITLNWTAPGDDG